MNKEDFYFAKDRVDNSAEEQMPRSAANNGPVQQNKFSDIFVYCLIGSAVILIIIVIYLLFSGPSKPSAPEMQKRPIGRPPQRPPVKPKTMPDLQQSQPEQKDENIDQLKDSWGRMRARNKNKFKVKKDLEEQGQGQEDTQEEYYEEEIEVDQVATVQGSSRFEEEE